jgi:hypothetical protein
MLRKSRPITDHPAATEIIQKLDGPLDGLPAYVIPPCRIDGKTVGMSLFVGDRFVEFDSDDAINFGNVVAGIIDSCCDDYHFGKKACQELVHFRKITETGQFAAAINTANQGIMFRVGRGVGMIPSKIWGNVWQTLQNLNAEIESRVGAVKPDPKTEIATLMNLRAALDLIARGHRSGAAQVGLVGSVRTEFVNEHDESVAWMWVKQTLANVAILSDLMDHGKNKKLTGVGVDGLLATEDVMP